jgi:hypothetical protein
VLCGNAREYRQQLLEQSPAPEVIDDQLIFDQRAVGKRTAGVRPPQPALRQKPAAYGAVAQHRYSTIAAQSHHGRLRPVVDERILQLVRPDGHTGREQLFEVRRIEIRDADARNLAGALQSLKLESRLHVARHGKVPPVKLHQVETLHAEA